MCYDCYIEYDEPMIINETTKNVARLIDRIYEYHLSGGGAHIVVDDWNIEDDSIDFCIGYVNTQEYIDDVCVSPEQRQAENECLEALRVLSIEERASAMAIHEGWLNFGERNENTV